jgi:cell wall assembly regulator SMI1
MNRKRWDADGSPEKALQNIECHIRVLLPDDLKEAINWHDDQNIALAVMRIIDELLHRDTGVRF